MHVLVFREVCMAGIEELLLVVIRHVFLLLQVRICSAHRLHQWQGDRGGKGVAHCSKSVSVLFYSITQAKAGILFLFTTPFIHLHPISC